MNTCAVAERYAAAALRRSLRQRWANGCCAPNSARLFYPGRLAGLTTSPLRFEGRPRARRSLRGPSPQLAARAPTPPATRSSCGNQGPGDRPGHLRLVVRGLVQARSSPDQSRRSRAIHRLAIGFSTYRPTRRFLLSTPPTASRSVQIEVGSQPATSTTRVFCTGCWRQRGSAG